MRVVIVGAGAIGGALCARLAATGTDVTAVARGAHLATIQQRGLRLIGPDSDEVVRLEAVASVAEARCDAADVVVLATKSQDTYGLLRELARVAPSDTPVACAQNGVDNERLALRMFTHVYGVVVMCPASHLVPGEVVVHAAPRWGMLDVGAWPGAVDDTAVALASAFTAAGFASEATEDIALLKWAKLLSNLGNAVDALYEPNDDAHELWRQASAEGRTVLDALGVDVARAESLLRARASTFEHRQAGEGRGGGSSWQSLARGAGEIESDFLNGEVALQGRLLGVATPVNEALRVAANTAAARGVAPRSLDARELLDSLG